MPNRIYKYLLAGTGAALAVALAGRVDFRSGNVFGCPLLYPINLEKPAA